MIGGLIRFVRDYRAEFGTSPLSIDDAAMGLAALTVLAVNLFALGRGWGVL